MDAWRPPLTVEERIKATLIPPRLYIRHLYRRSLRRGEAELHLVPILAGRGGVCVDVGANKGVYSYAMLRCGATVHAFEPNPKAYATLERWGVPAGIHLSRTALSDRAGAASLLVPQTRKGFSNQGASLSAVKVGSAHQKITVETARLDDLHFERLDFLKIDAEGHEAAILAGGLDTIGRHKPNLLIEIEERHTKTPVQETIKPLLEIGYRCFFVQDGKIKPCSATMKTEKYVFNYIFLPS